jgi:N-acetylglutamate synthase-like GNAT family acetyltransferase
MLLAAEQVSLVEIPRPQENFEQSEEAARFILKNLYRDVDPDEEKLAKQLRALSKRTTLAAFDGRLMIATGSLQIAPPDEAWLEDMAVLDVEGIRRVGWGSKIVHALEERAVESGMEHLMAVPARSATGFYEKLGYEPSDADPDIFTKDLSSYI